MNFKKAFQYLFFITGLVIIIWVFTGHLFEHNLQTVAKEKQVSCQKSNKTIPVTIDKEGFNPREIKVQVCDSIEFKNHDGVPHQVAFGPHPNHLIYPGFNEQVIFPGKTQSLLLTARGKYELHDHLNEELEVRLIVTLSN